MASIKNFYLHPKLRSWSLLKLFSIYAHSSIEASLKKSSWNSSHNQLNQLHGSTLRADTQFTKYLFPAERSLLKLRSKHTRETNNFSALFRGGFCLQHSKKYSNFRKCFLSNSRDGVCLCPRDLVCQSYCRVNDLGGKIPMAGSGKFVREDLHQRDLPNAFTKKIFKTFQSQVSVDVTDNFRSLPSEDNCWVMVTGILRAER